MAVYQEKDKNKWTKDGRKWFYKVYYSDINNNKKIKKSKKFMTKKDAIEAEIIFLTNIGENTDNNFTVDEIMNIMIKNDKSVKESTLFSKNDRYRKHIKPYFGNNLICKLTEVDIEKWKKTIDKIDYEITYKQAIFSTLSSIFTYAYKNNLIKTNIIRNVSNFKSDVEKIIDDTENIRYILPEDFQIFQSVINDITYKAYFNFIFYMGTRRGEVASLKWTDINFDTNKVKIIKQLNFKTFDDFPKETNTKNKKNRVIGMPKQLVSIMKEYYENQKTIYGFNDNWYVFGGIKHLSYTSINRKKDEYFEKANMSEKRITLHEFRHSHASYLISNGISPILIAERLGDTIDVVLKTYAHLFPNTEKQIIDALEKLGTI